MALVAYDYDSNSDNEEEESEASAVIIPPKAAPAECFNTLSQLLSDLPQTKSAPIQVTEDKLEDFIPKYQAQPKEKKPKVRITIPSLSQFANDEDDQPTPKKPKYSKNSGLLALLPPVKGSPLSTKSFIPQVLKNKPKTKAAGLVPDAVKKKAEIAKRAAIKKLTGLKAGSDAESDDDVEVPETFDEDMWHKICGRPKKREIPKIKETTFVAEPTYDTAPEPIKPYDGLDNEAFKELVGKSKRPVNIKLIDINEEEVHPDPDDIWATRALTDPESAPKPVIEEPVDPTRKKKHHITYLAEQAKANEQELNSQWSSSKSNRNMTRAKYGF